MKAVVKRIEFPGNRRILAISDIHGNLAFLQALLAKCDFCTNDILVVVGDFLEKGPESLKTLRYFMALSCTHTVHFVAGNCDTLALSFLEWADFSASGIMSYLKGHRESILYQMSAELGFEVRDKKDFPTLRKLVNEQFLQELDFLRQLPTVLETPQFVFVHGGVPSFDHMENLDAWSCKKNDAFLDQGHSFPKYCVVGHWPVTLYRETIPCCDPIVERERKIISIDGGCSVKAGGQLNALVIASADTEEFSWIRYDAYPVAKALVEQKPSAHPFTIRWVDNAVSIREEGPEFSLCQHRSTGTQLAVLNSYLRRLGENTYCEDFTDFCLGVEAGDALSIIEETSRGYLVKKDGVIGWYRGTLERLEIARKQPKALKN